MNALTKKRWITALWVSSLFFLVMGLIIVIVPAISPATGAQVADLLRSALGPQPVANIESVSFGMQDRINKLVSQYDGGKVQLTLKQDTRQTPAPTVASANFDAPAKLNVVTALPQIGWQAFGPQVNGMPVMAQTVLALDPERTYAAIALVRIDLSKLQLHMEPGFLEPSHTPAIQTAIPNLGSIPKQDLQNLIAAFNGGFKAINGNYGMMVNGVTLLQPIPGMATLGIYQDGHIQIGAWGQTINATPDLIAYRQNCPLILQNGSLTPSISDPNRLIWGQTISNSEITWRTGVGITQDGRYLIYAVGNATNVDYLAEALQQAGAYNAMQLDINRHWVHFAIYTAKNLANLPVQAQQLLAQMETDPKIYLVPHSRDFFYLTLQ